MDYRLWTIDHGLWTIDLILHRIHLLYFSRAIFLRRLGYFFNVFRCCAAASSEKIHEPFFQIFFHLRGHLIRSLVILTKLVWKSCVGIGAHKERGLFIQHLEVRSQRACSQGEIQSDTQQGNVLNRDEESFRGLS